MKAIPDVLLVIAAAALSLAAGFVFNWYVAVGVAVACWLGLTWYHADDEPVFGPRSDRRVTFRDVLIGALRDVRDLFGLDKVWAWAVRTYEFCGAQLGALLLTLDAYIAATPELKQVVMATPYGLPILLAVNFFAFIATRRAGQA